MKEEIDLAEFVSSFIRFENDNDLFSIRIKGHCLWDYLRYTVSNLIIYSSYNYEERKVSGLRNYISEIAPNIRDWIGNVAKESNAYDIIFFDSGHHRLIDGKKVNIYIYPVLKELASRYRVLFIDPSPWRPGNQNVYPCDVLRSRPYWIWARIKSIFVQYDKKEKEVFLKISSKIMERFGFNVDIHALAKSVFSFQIMHYRLYLSLFRKFRPRMIVYADNASLKHMIEAAHDLGIQTVDLQHSLISRLNILYRYSEDIDRNKISPTVSDTILTFGRYWNDKYSLPVKRTAVGFPYFEMMKRLRSPSIPDRSKNILVISMTFSKDEFTRVALDLAKRLPYYRIFYKLRPEDYDRWQERYPRELAETTNITVIDNDGKSLYEYFNLCGCQIGINSTALYEGLGFGLITFILKTGWYQEMASLIDNGQAFLVSDAEEIATLISKGIQPVRLEPDDLFQSESIARMTAELEGILKRAKRMSSDQSKDSTRRTA